MPVPDPDLFDGSRSPGEVLRLLLEERGWTQEQFADITGRSRITINAIMTGKAGITPETATVFAAAFGNEASDWLRLEASYRLSLVKSETSEVSRRAKIYGLLPIREMQKRGWLSEHATLESLEADVKKFLGTDSLDERPAFLIATRRPNADEELTPTQRAWCARARQMAAPMLVHAFDPSRLGELEAALRELAAYPKEARHLPRVLREYGVRFVVIEPLPGAKIDGAAFWLDERSPVIAVSLRFDRVDAFWFTIMHEFSHIAHNDALSVDTDVLDLGRAPAAADETEARANREAATRLIEKRELESFMRRVGPYYSRDRVIQFAHSVRIHPGIIVGQLQHRGEIGYGALRDLLSKVRNVVTETAITDGWGQTISPAILSS